MCFPRLCIHFSSNVTVTFPEPTAAESPEASLTAGGLSCRNRNQLREVDFISLRKVADIVSEILDVGLLEMFLQAALRTPYQQIGALVEKVLICGFWMCASKSA
jgi:hypothetical protein